MIFQNRVKVYQRKGKIEKDEVFKSEINSDYSDEVLRFYNACEKKVNDKTENLEVLKLALDAREMSVVFKST